MRAGFRTKTQLLAWWKWILSFRSQDWELEHYPIVIREQQFDTDFDERFDSSSRDEVGPRFKLHSHRASIVNWVAMDGTGNSPHEALDELRATFRAQKASRVEQGRPLPRPGTKVPIQFASQERVNTHPELKADFIRRVLGLQWALITDESCLWHFHAQSTNEALVAKIREVYGISVDDIESGSICEILDRIAQARQYP